MGKSSSSRCCRGTRHVQKPAGTQRLLCPHPGRGTATYFGPCEFLLHYFILWFHFQGKLEVSDSAFVAAEHLLQCQRETLSITRVPGAGSDPSWSHYSPSPGEGCCLQAASALEPPPHFGVPPPSGAETQRTHRLLRQSPQDLGEVGIHLLRRPLEELPAASHEQSVTYGERGLDTEGTLAPLPGTGCGLGTPTGWIPPMSIKLGRWGGQGARPVSPVPMGCTSAGWDT